MRLGMDLDGVCYRFQDTYIFLAKHYLGVDIDPDKWTYWNYPDSLMTASQNKWMWTEGIRHGLFRNGSLYKGTAEAMRILGQVADIVTITSRPRAAIQDTLDWLSYQKFPLSELHVIGDTPKSSIKCDMYVDDAMHNAVDLATNVRVPVLLWDRVWNQGRISVPHVYRVRSWSEVIEWAERMAVRVKSRQVRS